MLLWVDMSAASVQKQGVMMIKIAYDENGELLVYDGYGQLCLGVSENYKGGLTIEFKKKAKGSTRTIDDGTTATVGSGTQFNPSSILPLSTKSWAKVKEPIDTSLEDPVHYYNGVNGLTIAESAARAFHRVRNDTWTRFSNDEVGESNSELILLFETLIDQRVGRDYIYRIAGRAVNATKIVPTDKKTLFEWFVEFVKQDGFETS